MTLSLVEVLPSCLTILLVLHLDSDTDGLTRTTANIELHHSPYTELHMLVSALH